MTDIRTKNETEKNTRYGKRNRKKEEGEGADKKEAGNKMSKKKRIRASEEMTDAHRKAWQGYHHGDNQQLIRAGAILRWAALKAAASRRHV